MMIEPIIALEELTKRYPIRGGLLGGVTGFVRALDGVSFQIQPGETFGIVGESGCGKSTLCRALLMLERPDTGRVTFLGRDMLKLPREELRQMRRHIQMVFQDPYSSLPPHMTIGDIIREGMIIHHIGASLAEQREKGEWLLSKVGLLPLHWAAAPSELSGGQRQRAVIARALAVMPRLLICDEPVSALDVSIRAQILNLFVDLQDEFGLTYIFVSHDLAVVKLVSTRVAVMYLGTVVELCSRDALYSAPLHPYSITLLLSAPSTASREALLARRKQLVIGEPASASRIPPGCRYHPRCTFADEQCRVAEPQLVMVAEGRSVACHHWQRVAPVGAEIAGLLNACH